MATPIVLDASAVLALLNAEPGADEVAAVLPQAVLCSVNRSEVLSRLLDWGLSPEEARFALQALELPCHSFDDSLADIAANLRPATRKHGLSLGDRACLALALQLGASVQTADRPWLALGETLGLDIHCIRPDQH
jgi:ribonuclease VapC